MICDKFISKVTFSIMRVLLVEPDYRTKFPPLGLLKLASYHKNRGDEISFVRGMQKDVGYWDRVYISTLFSFYHQKIVDTILHYKRSLGDDINRVFVGGAYASMFPNEIFKETGIWPITGLLNAPNKLGLGDDDKNVDSMIPDFSLLEEMEYDYGLQDCYFGYATRGCIRRCEFCAVWKLEPEFNPYTGLKKYIEKIIQRYGEKQNLVLMDNNVLASKQFDRIIGDIVELHFERGSKFRKKSRYVDFNQGLDARLITKEKAKLLASICIKPVRLAYDNIAAKDVFEQATAYLSSEGIIDFSTYILYNHEEPPSDFYERVAHCNELNRKFNIKIYSFPMRYAPLGAKDRSHVGPLWHRKQISGLYKILNVTNGTISPGDKFFLRAFGHSPADFEEICAMPDHYILQRDDYEDNKRFFKNQGRGGKENRKTSRIGRNDTRNISQS